MFSKYMNTLCNLAHADDIDASVWGHSFTDWQQYTRSELVANSPAQQFE